MSLIMSWMPTPLHLAIHTVYCALSGSPYIIYDPFSLFKERQARMWQTPTRCSFLPYALCNFGRFLQILARLSAIKSELISKNPHQHYMSYHHRANPHQFLMRSFHFRNKIFLTALLCVYLMFLLQSG